MKPIAIVVSAILLTCFGLSSARAQSVPMQAPPPGALLEPTMSRPSIQRYRLGMRMRTAGIVMSAVGVGLLGVGFYTMVHASGGRSDSVGRGFEGFYGGLMVGLGGAHVVPGALLWGFGQKQINENRVTLGLSAGGLRLTW
jgi:hypothetical protein